MHGFICWKSFKAHYVQIGHGPAAMLAFPGFHRECEDFKVFESSLGQKFTIYAFDLFHHGQSEILDAKQTFELEDLNTMINMLCEIHGIDRFALMGYSLGGKIALTAYSNFSNRVTDLYLFAPYGLKPSGLLRTIENWSLAEKIFHHLIKKPGLFFTSISVLYRLNLLHKRRYEFLQHQMESEKRRGMLFNTWKCYRSLKPDLQKIIRHLRENTINIKLFYGSLDPVEPPANAQLLTANLNQKNTLTIIPVGHNLICEKTNAILAEQLLVNS